ncbi:MAG: ABC transporter substrate-binding protein [Pseudomonadota bacterium]
MTNRRFASLSRRGFSGLALGAAIAFAAPTAQALSTSEAEVFVESVVADLRGLVENGRSGPEGAAEFLALLETKASLDAVGKFAVGRNWLEMSDAQKSAYGAAFRNYISKTYQNRFGEYAGEDIVLNGSVDAGRKGVLVKSLLKRPSTEGIVVEWLVSDRSGKTRLSDIVFEGVSLAITLREIFGGMIEKRGGNMDQFIADLAASSGA